MKAMDASIHIIPAGFYRLKLTLVELTLVVVGGEAQQVIDPGDNSWLPYRSRHII
jgi:hypothetical protein